MTSSLDAPARPQLAKVQSEPVVGAQVRPRKPELEQAQSFLELCKCVEEAFNVVHADNHFT